MVMSETQKYRDGLANLLRVLLLIAIASVCFILVGCNSFFRIPQYGLLWTDDGPDPGTGKYNVGVIPRYWDFSFPEKHYFAQNILDTYGVSVFFDWVDWKTFFCFRDAARDKEFDYVINYDIIGMNHSFMARKSRHFFGGDWGRSSLKEQSYENPFLKGFEAATVVLIGWRFDTWDPGTKDRRVHRIGIRIRDVVYDSNAGKINWTVQSQLSGDAVFRYVWKYTYLIIAFNKGVVKSHTISNTTGDNWDTLYTYGSDDVYGRIPAPEGGKNRKNGTILLQGWFIDIMGLPDEKLACNFFCIRNLYNKYGPPTDDGDFSIDYYVDAFFPMWPKSENNTEIFRYLDVDVAALWFDDGGIGWVYGKDGHQPDGECKEVSFRYYYDPSFPVP